MNIEISRRNFLKGAGAGVAVTTLAAFGFGEAEAAFVEGLRPFDMLRTGQAPSERCVVVDTSRAGSIAVLQLLPRAQM